MEQMTTVTKTESNTPKTENSSRPVIPEVKAPKEVPEEAGIFMTSDDNTTEDDEYYDAYVEATLHQGEELELNYATHECYLTNEKALTKKGEETGSQRDSRKCAICDTNDHNVFKCPLNNFQKRQIIRQKKKCYNCLKTGHGVKQCRSMPCRNCWLYGRRSYHHTSMCKWDKHSKFGQPGAPRPTPSGLPPRIIFPSSVKK